MRKWSQRRRVWLDVERLLLSARHLPLEAGQRLILTLRIKQAVSKFTIDASRLNTQELIEFMDESP